MYGGKFIVVEGIDGCGKTIHSKNLCKDLRKKGYCTIWTCEPMHGKIGKLIREYYITKVNIPTVDLYLFLADRAEHVSTVILPALEKGTNVVSDRYKYSHIAYQGTSGIDPLQIKKMNEAFPVPDLTLIIDCLPEECFRRIFKRSGNDDKHRVKFENCKVLERISSAFHRMPEMFPDENIKLIDGNRTIKEIGLDIFAEATKLLG